MDNQYTPTYHRLWNRDFSLLIASELLLCMACYMTIPFLPYRLFMYDNIDAIQAGLTMVLFVTGICMSGFFSCWLIQRYRRNKVFFISALCLATTMVSISFFDSNKIQYASQHKTAILICTCLLGGMFFGNAKRVLSCTLLIDKTESCHRTEANYAAIWIARLTIVIGPIITILIHDKLQSTLFYGIAVAMTLIAATLVMTVKFPFRAPEEGTRIVSIDRFFLPKGWNVAIVIAVMSAALGVVMSTHISMEFFSSMIAGFLIAILTLRYTVVRTGRYTSAIGNACILIALLAMNLHNGLLDDTLKPMVFGMGFGLTSSEQLYKLLECCDHCQRSTAESTYFMSSDGGLFIGIAAGWISNHPIVGQTAIGERAALCLMTLATAMCCINAIIKKERGGYHA